MGLTTLQKDKLRETEGLAGLHPSPDREAQTIEARLIDVLHAQARQIQKLAGSVGRGV